MLNNNNNNNIINNHFCVTHTKHFLMKSITSFYNVQKLCSFFVLS